MATSFVKTVPSVSLSTMQGESFHAKQFSSTTALSSSSSSILSFARNASVVAKRHQQRQQRNGLVVFAAAGSSNDMPLTGVVFQPFEEVKKELINFQLDPRLSLARQFYSDDVEAAINEQINVEYNNSYVYHSMYAYFDRDNVALRGMAKFFKESSLEEREHAEKLMEYQNKRGGRVKFHSIIGPPSEFDHIEKGEALYSMELALALEKLTNEKLLNLHSVAERNKDAQLIDYIESEFLEEQVESIKKIAEYVSQLRRVGKGHGVWHFDQMLLHEGEAVV